MTKFQPDTCTCVIIIDDKDVNNRRKMVLKQQCRSHNTVSEALDYNKLPKFRIGTDDKQTQERTKSKTDPLYQRR